MDTPLPAVDAATAALIARRAVGDESFVLADWRIAALAHTVVNPVSGGLYRLSGRGWIGERPREWSAILKIAQLPAGDSATFSASDDKGHWNYWQREPLAYASDLLDGLADGLEAPRCYRISSRGPHVRWLWLEDVAGQPATEWPLERYGLAARHIGRWQGQYLRGRTAPDLAWLSRSWLRARLELETPPFELLGADSWRNPLVSRWFPRSLAERLPRLWQDRGYLLAALERQPRTLCHLDVWPPNLFARRADSGADETVLLDWSYLGWGAAGLDAGNLVPDATTRWHVAPSELGRLEALVYPGYLAGLAEAGWQGDERAVRLGFALAGGMLYSLFACWWIGLALDESRHAAAEQRAGRPIDAFFEQKSYLLDYALGLVDEGYALARTLGAD